VKWVDSEKKKNFVEIQHIPKIGIWKISRSQKNSKPLNTKLEFQRYAFILHQKANAKEIRRSEEKRLVGRINPPKKISTLKPTFTLKPTQTNVVTKIQPLEKVTNVPVKIENKGLKKKKC